MKISVFNQQKDLSIKVASVKAIVKQVLASENFITDELTIYFVSMPRICELHQLFFQDPTPTDTISLPIDGPERDPRYYHVLGEIFICPKKAIEYLKKGIKQGAKNDPYQETTLYLIHGLLHLIGYDDMEVEERKKMRAAEKKHMGLLKIKNSLLSAKTNL